MNSCVLINKLSAYRRWAHTAEKQKQKHISCKPKIAGALREKNNKNNNNNNNKTTKQQQQQQKTTKTKQALRFLVVWLEFVLTLILMNCEILLLLLFPLPIAWLLLCFWRYYMFEIVVMSLALIWLTWMTLVVTTVRACAVQTVILFYVILSVDSDATF